MGPDIKSVYDPILALSQSPKIEVWFVQQWQAGGVEHEPLSML